MNISTKLLKAAAGAAGGAGLDIDEVFSTYLYDGNSSTQTITNGIDLSGEGGLVWVKKRNGTTTHSLVDSERGDGKMLQSSSTDAEINNTGYAQALTSTGFTVYNWTTVNNSGDEYVSWSFRKAPKFFDVISIDVADPEPTSVTVNHNLGQEVGMVIMKPYLHTYPWYVWHRSIGANYSLELNSTAPKSYVGGSGFSSTSTTITIPGSFVHSGSNNGKCILYLFAHNNNDGEFGPDKDKDVIKCGSYTGNYTKFKDINLGFEPQWVLIKNTSTNYRDWLVFDNMRGAVVGGNDAWLRVDNNQQEYSNELIEFRANGFSVADDTNVNQSGNSHIYVAIRRGPLTTPTSATDVFTPVRPSSSGTFTSTSGFVTDFSINKGTGSGDTAYAGTRLTGPNSLTPHSTAAEASVGFSFDFMDKVTIAGSGDYSSWISWNWKRAPGYFDVCSWKGNDTAGRSVAHNLGVVPEMIWVKNRSATVEWAVYHKDVNNGFLNLNTTSAKIGAYVFGADSSNDAQSATNIFLSSGNSVNELNKYYIGYLFATVAGVSKVGSYSGTGSTQTIDCGFSNGARFVLIKCTNDAENWIVFDSVRGIVSGNDPYVALNTTDAEITSSDFIDPVSSGFAVNTNSGEVNNSSNTYIFYAIA